MSAPSIDTSELRSIVGDVLSELLRRSGTDLPSALAQDASGHGSDDKPPTTDVFVRVRDDADVAELVNRVIALCSDPHQRAALSQGGFRFRLLNDAALAVPSPQAPTVISTGAVTEAIVKRAAKADSRLLLGPRAVVTPLGREAAQALGVVLERTPR